MALGDNIKRIRKLKRVQVAELAEKTQIKPESIYAWERGEYNPSEENLQKIAKALGVPVKEFYEENPTHEQNRTDSKENALMDDSIGLVRSLVEMEKVGNYMFVPKLFFEGDYKLSLKSERDKTIATLERLVANLEGEVADKAQQIAELKSVMAKAATAKKTK